MASIFSTSSWSLRLYQFHGKISQPIYRILEWATWWYLKRASFSQRFFDASMALGGTALLSRHISLIKKGEALLIGILVIEGIRLGVHMLAHALQKDNFIHIRGAASELACQNPKIMTWNILGLPAGLYRMCGGAETPFRVRAPEIFRVIRQENPDIVILQECDFIDNQVSTTIIQEFAKEYAHFFICNGRNMLGSRSGIVVMTKCAVASYAFTPFKASEWQATRGFATLKIKARPSDEHPFLAIIGTHLQSGNAELCRQMQLGEIYAIVQKISDVEHIIFAGDSNIDARNAEERELTKLDDVLDGIHSYSTCTNLMNKLIHPNTQDPDEEAVDQIALVRHSQEKKKASEVIVDFRIIPAYSPDNFHEALSDHHALVATIRA